MPLSALVHHIRSSCRPTVQGSPCCLTSRRRRRLALHPTTSTSTTTWPTCYGLMRADWRRQTRLAQTKHVVVRFDVLHGVRDTCRCMGCMSNVGCGCVGEGVCIGGCVCVGRRMCWRGVCWTEAVLEWMDVLEGVCVLERGGCVVEVGVNV